MQFEIVDSVPDSIRRNPNSYRSVYDEALDKALEGSIVKIPSETVSRANSVRVALRALILRRGLALRAYSRGNAVYLERKDV